MEKKYKWTTWICLALSMILSTISLIMIFCVKDELRKQGANDISEVYVGYDNHLWIGSERTNCCVPETQVEDNVFENTMLITGKMSKYFHGGYIELAQKKVALMPYYKKTAKVALYSGMEITDITIYAENSGNLAVGTAKISTIILARTTGSDFSVANAQSYSVSQGENKIHFKTPLRVDKDETIVFGGNNSVSLYYIKDIPVDDEFGNFTVLDKNAHDEVIESSGESQYADTLALKVEVKLVEEELPVFKNLKEDAFTDNNANGNIGNADLSGNGHYAYNDLNMFAGKRITKIDVPVVMIQEPVEGQGLFTVSVFENTQSGMEGPARRSYEFQIPVTDTQNGEYNIGSWETFECNIQLKEDETLAFGGNFDTIRWGYSRVCNLPEYTFSECGNGEWLGDGTCSMYFDVFYTQIKNSQKQIENLEKLEAEAISLDKATFLKQKLSGKQFSILGDSISTFSGWSNNANYNTTIGNNDIWYWEQQEGVYRVEQTWWYKIMEKTEMNLCVNNSYSGDKVADKAQTRCVQLHDDTYNGDQQEDVNPEIIAVYIGINDFRAGCTSSDFENAYEKMLAKLKSKYHEAKVFLFTLLPNKAHSRSDSDLFAFNEAIEHLAKRYQCEVVDLFKDSAITVSNYNLYMSDEVLLHPNELGMERISDCFLDALYEVYCSKD